MSIASLIRAMSDAGATPEAIALAVEAIEAVEARDAARRAKRAEQKRRERDRAATVARQSDDGSATHLSPKERSPTPPKEITPIPVSEPVGSSTESAREFSEFWTLFPNKVGKRDAAKSFAAARKRADFPAIMAGLRRYVAKTDDRPWCNPTTFLNQDRWDDQPAAPAPRGTSPPSKPNAFTAYDEIARMKGWTDEPGSIPVDHEDAQRLPAVGGERHGAVVDLRRGADFRVGSGNR